MHRQCCCTLNVKGSKTLFSHVIIRLALSAVLLLSSSFSVFAQIQRPISGVVAATTSPVSVSYLQPDGSAIGRTASVGDPIYLNDEISTDGNTNLQILLKDQTVFTIGPNTVLVFDNFIYDPSDASVESSLTATVKKGTFKFISGRISKSSPNAMKLKVANATASIRGTSVAGRVNEDGDADVVLLSGAISVQSAATTAPVDVIQPGWGLSIGAGGAAGDPFQFTASQINDIVASVEFTAPAVEAELGADAEGDSAADSVRSASITPETAETVAEVVTLAVSNLEQDDQGNINVADLASYILENDLGALLGLSPSDLQIETVSGVTIEANLLNYLLGGGQPMWVTVRNSAGGDVGNPPPASATVDYNLYNSTYFDKVSDAYTGSVNFVKSGVVLSRGSLMINDDVYTTTATGSGSADYDVTLDYGTGSVSGTFGINDLVIGSESYGSSTAAVSYDGTTGSTDYVMDNIELSSIDFGSGSNAVKAELAGAFGSITDGTNTLDGSIGGFTILVNAEASNTVSAREAIADDQNNVIDYIPKLRAESFQAGTVSP